MRHLKAGRKLGRNSSHRKAMFSNMVASLLLHERIQTTDAKAKEVRRLAERMITVAKHGADFERQASEAADANDKQRFAAASLHKRRQAAAYLKNADVVQKLFGNIEERFRGRPGGYTRLIKLGFRKGDGADISFIELVDRDAVLAAGAASAAEESKKSK